MKVQSCYWPSGQPIAECLVRQFEDVSSFFTYDPSATDAMSKRADWLDRHRTCGQYASRDRLVEVLERFNRRFQTSSAVFTNIEHLKRSETLCVVGGQQAGLLGGPLLVMYKAIRVIQLARHYTKQLGRNVVPIFWIAGEDHDFDEVNHAYIPRLDAGLQLCKMAHPTGRRSPISNVVIDPEAWSAILIELEQLLPQTEFKEPLLERLREIAQHARTLVDFFAQLLADWFGSDGLIVLDAHDAELRAIQGDFFGRLIRENNTLRAATKQADSAIRQAGYTPQVQLQDQCANVFVIDQEERVLLYHDEHREQTFSDRKQERFWTVDQLLDLATHAPERLSNNVLTRPLMQEYTLPVLATVLGPGEIAYWAMTKPLFEALNMQMPLIMPRLQSTLIEGTVAKQIAKLGMTVQDALFQLGEKEKEWLIHHDEWRMAERFATVRDQFRQQYEPILTQIAQINVGLGKLGETNLDKIMSQIDFLEQKTNDAILQQHEASLRQFERIRQSLHPNGNRQERVLTAISFLNKYGSAWIRHLLEETFPEQKVASEHQLCYI